jgi:hypothetical protein
MAMFSAKTNMLRLSAIATWNPTVSGLSGCTARFAERGGPRVDSLEPRPCADEGFDEVDNLAQQVVGLLTELLSVFSASRGCSA